MQQNRKDPGILPKQPEPFRKHYPLTHGLLLTNPKQQYHFSKEMYTKFSRKQHIKIVNIIKTHNNVSWPQLDSRRQNLEVKKNQNMALQQNNNSSKKTYLTKKSVITHKLSAFPNNNTKHIPIDYYLI